VGIVRRLLRLGVVLRPVAGDAREARVDDECDETMRPPVGVDASHELLLLAATVGVRPPRWQPVRDESHDEHRRDDSDEGRAAPAVPLHESTPRGSPAVSPARVSRTVRRQYRPVYVTLDTAAVLTASCNRGVKPPTGEP